MVEEENTIEETTAPEEETPHEEGPDDVVQEETQKEAPKEEEGKPKKGTSPIKIIGILIIAAVLLAFLSGGYLYFSLVKPLMGLEITPQGIEPVSLDPLTFEGVIDLGNPGSEVTLPRIDLDLILDGELVASGGMDSTTIPGGSTKSVTVQLKSPMSVSELTSHLAGKTQVDIKIGGKIHSKPIAIPIPPISLPIDTSEFLSDFNTPAAMMMKTLGEVIKKDPDLTVGEALESPEFIRGMEEQMGKGISSTEIAEMKTMFEAQGIMDENAEEVLNNPAFITMLEQMQ